jgi:hypothetical protein
VLSQVDKILASLAKVTTDRDFTGLPDLRTEDWSIDLDRGSRVAEDQFQDFPGTLSISVVLVHLDRVRTRQSVAE